MPQLYDKFADLQALEQEKAKVLSIFDDVRAGLKELNNFGIKLNSSKSVAEIEELKTSTDSYNKELSDLQKKILELTGKMATLTGEESKQLESIKQVTQLTKQLTSVQVKNTLSKQGAYADLQRQKLANTELNKSIQLRLKIQQAEMGSEERLLLVRDKANGILKKLSQTQRDSARGQKLQDFSKEINDQINKIQQKVGNFRNNVGNYANSLADGFEKVRQEIGRLQKQADDLRSSGDPAGAARVESSIRKLDDVIKISYNSNQSYAKSVKQIEREYQNLAVSGNYSNEFLTEFKKFAAEAKDSAADLKDEIKALSSDTRGLDLAAGSISFLASTFEAVSGAAALAGANSEDVERSIQKLVAIQSVANGVREAARQITEHGTAANKAYNYVVDIGNKLFGKGIPLAQRFGAAVKGIVVLAVITFIIAAIKYLTSFEDKAEDAKKQLEDFNNELERNKKLLKDLGESDAFDFKSKIQDLKTATAIRVGLAKNEKDRIKIENEGKKKEYDLEIQFRNDQIVKLRKQQENADEDIVDQEFRKQNFLRAAQAVGIKTISKERLDAYNEAIKQARLAKEEIVGELKNQQRDLVLFQKEGNTQLAEERNAENEKAAQEAKERSKKERDDYLELFKFRQGLIKEQADLESGEDSNFSVNAKIEAAKRGAVASAKILEEQRKHDLDEEKLTTSKKILINEEYNNNILNLQLELQSQILKIRIDGLQKEKQIAEEGAAYFDEVQTARVQGKAKKLEDDYNKEKLLLEKQADEDRKLSAENLERKLKEADEDTTLGNNRFKVQLKAKNDYQRRLEEIEVESHKRSLEADIRFYEAQLQLLKDQGADVTDALAKLAKARADLAAIGADATKTEIEKEKGYIDELKEKYLELGDAIKNVFTSAVNGVFDRQKDNIQGQIDDIDRLRAAQTDAIAKSTDDEQVKAAKIKIIETQAQNRKEELARRQRQLDRQKAIFERSQQIFEIASNTIKAVAVINANAAIAAANPLVPAPVALANSLRIRAQIPLAVATGAAGLAALLATPIPKYYTGTDYSVGGKAWVAERGRELAIEPSGKVKMFNKKSIVELIQGTKILPNEVTENIISSASQDIVHPAIAFVEDRNKNNLQEEILYELKEIKKKSRISIHNSSGIESSSWYHSNIKN